MKVNIDKNLIYIYYLIDPLDKSIKYVGKSNNPYERLKSHLSDKTESDKTTWIQSLLLNGYEPDLFIAETCHKSNTGIRTRVKIHVLNSAYSGNDLFNCERNICKVYSVQKACSENIHQFKPIKTFVKLQSIDVLNQFIERSKPKEIEVPLNSKFHIYKGTSGLLNIHTKHTLYIKDTLLIGNLRLKIATIKDDEKSSFFSNHNFYVLHFKLCPNNSFQLNR